MANELDELVGMASEADRIAFQQILDRNPILKGRAESQAALFAALASGDNDAITEAQIKFVKPAAATATPSSATATLDDLLKQALPMIQQKIDEGVAAKKTEFVAIAKQEAADLLKIEGEKYLTTAIQQADQLYSVRVSHRGEFGEELDTKKFTEFINANANKYPTLADAHNAMMQEKRVANQIAKGIDDYKAANPHASVPGGPGRSLIDSTSAMTPLPGMMKDNEKRANPTGIARGDGLDNAVKAWRQTLSGGGAGPVN